MIKLETYINEKLKVTKGSGVPNLILILDSTNREEFNLQLKNLLEYLKDDSDLPIADLEDIENGRFKKIDSKYKNRNDTFLYVYGKLIDYGTWDEMYSIYWSRVKKTVNNFNNGMEGFKDFICDGTELKHSKGVFIITKNEELMKQIDILKKKADPVV